MSMNGVDYTKKLSDVRNDFYRTMNRTREAYNDSLAQQERTHENVEKNQLETFKDNKLKLEDNFRKTADSIREETAESLKRKQVDYEKQLNSERKNFSQRTQEMRGRFNDDLNTINKQFSTALRTEADQNEALRGEQRKVFDDKLLDMRQRHDKEVKNTVDRFNAQERKNKLRQNDDRNRMLEAQRREVEDIVKKATKDVAVTKRKTDRRVDGLRKSFDNQIEGVEKAKKRAMDAKNRAFKEVVVESNKNLNNTVDKINEGNLEERRRQFDKFDSVISNKNRENTVEQEALRREIRNLKKKEGNKFAGPNLDDIQKNSYDNTVKAYKREIGRLQDTLQIQNDNNKQDIQRALRARSLDFSDKMQDKDAGHARFITKLQENQGNQLDNLTETYREDAARKEKVAFVKDIRRQNVFNRQLKQADKNFANQFNAQQDSMDSQLESVRKQAAKDRTEFIQDTKKKISQERSVLRDGYNDTIRKLEIKNEQHIDSVKDDYEQQLVQKDKKITRLEDINRETITYYNDLITSKDRENNRTLKKELVAAQIEADQRAREFKREFSEKLKVMSHNNVIKVNKLTDSYEKRIKNLSDDFAKRIRGKDEESKSFVDQLVNSHKLERENLISKYESQISDIKRIHEQNMIELKDSLTARNENIS